MARNCRLSSGLDRFVAAGPPVITENWKSGGFPQVQPCSPQIPGVFGAELGVCARASASSKPLTWLNPGRQIRVVFSRAERNAGLGSLSAGLPGGQHATDNVKRAGTNRRSGTARPVLARR